RDGEIRRTKAYSHCHPQSSHSYLKALEAVEKRISPSRGVRKDPWPLGPYSSRKGEKIPLAYDW
ncbi:MAG: hypothetical protein SWE60_23370, partial [Thermodesulfobacteriota bacterium]|nr:hypothetical protein [Thermodesulfobacteriota bacterium]